MIDLSNVEMPEKSYGVVPAGEYVVSLAEATIKETKSGDGEYINAKFQIKGPEHEGRFLFQMFNIKNKNAQATQIGLQQLKGFMQAAGFESFVVKNITDLEGAKAKAVVKIKTDDYGEKNVISYFKSLDVPRGTKAEAVNSSEIPF